MNNDKVIFVLIMTLGKQQTQNDRVFNFISTL